MSDWLRERLDAYVAADRSRWTTGREATARAEPEEQPVADLAPGVRGRLVREPPDLDELMRATHNGERDSRWIVGGP